MLDIRDKDLAGRIARLKTRHGIIETPYLFPVIDPRRQELGLQEIKDLGFNAIITNAYMLWKHNRESVLENGVHRYLGFDGIIMTDSGAYQILQYGSIEVEPLEIVEFQDRIGVDIGVILDLPTGAAEDKRYAKYTVEETLRRAKEALSLIKDSGTLWVLPIQGGRFLDLVELSARRAAEIPGYAIYALGSPTPLMERYVFELVVEMIHRTRLHLDPYRPLHLFGAGHPMLIPLAVAMGVDFFDSASYILYARSGRYLTEHGTHRLEELEYLPCSCPVCTRYTARELREMNVRERTRLLALHNLHVIAKVLRETKQAIREGRLWEMVERYSRAHPALYRALQAMAGKEGWLESMDPRVKGMVKGVFLYDCLSTRRPEVSRHRFFMSHVYKPRIDARTLVLLPGDPGDKPFTSSKIYLRAREILGNAHYVFYTPFHGVVPEELASTYPLSQYEAPREPCREVIRLLVKDVRGFLEKHGRKYDEVVIVYMAGLKWSLNVCRSLSRAMGLRCLKLG